MKGRRGHGEGSVYRRAADGRWVATVEGGWTTTGRRIRLSAVRRTKAEALVALDALRRRARQGVPAADATVADYLTWWMATVKRGLAPSSKRAYRTRIRWASTHIGTVKLSRLSADDVEHLLAELERQGLSPWSRSKVRSLLSSALRYAERTGRVERNVAALVDGPRCEHRIDPLSADEARAVLSAARDHPYGLAAVLGLRLGLRIGEIAALRWDDVDLVAETLTVTAAKTPAGRRTLPLAGTADAFRARRAQQAAERLSAGPLWAPNGLHVLTGPLGAPLSTRTLRRHWGAWCATAGVGPRRFHASRHTCATLLLADGVPLEVVSAVLGHAALSITADVYARVSADAKRAALGRLRDTLG